MLQGRPSTRPAFRLPNEVLLEIFDICRSGAADMDKDMRWVNLTHVCRSWRLIALDYPTLWSTLPLTSLSWTREMVVRSRTAPLSVIAAVVDRREVDQLTEVMATHLPRMQCIDIKVEPLAPHEWELLISSFMTPSAPLLQELSIRTSNMGSIPDDLFQNVAPRLSVLRLTLCKINYSSYLFRGLTVLSLCLPKSSREERINSIPSTRMLVAILRDSPLLKDLRLEYAGPLAPPHTPLYSERDVIPLPYLEHLELEDRTDVCMRVALQIQIPTQAFVRLDCDVYGVDTPCASEVIEFVRKRCLSGAAEGNPLRTVEVAADDDMVRFQGLFGVEDQRRHLPASGLGQCVLTNVMNSRYTTVLSLLEELPVDDVVVLRLDGPDLLGDMETLMDTLSLFPSVETLCIQGRDDSFGPLDMLWDALADDICDDPLKCFSGSCKHSVLLPRLHRLVLRLPLSAAWPHDEVESLCRWLRLRYEGEHPLSSVVIESVFDGDRRETIMDSVREWVDIVEWIS